MIKLSTNVERIYGVHIEHFSGIATPAHSKNLFQLSNDSSICHMSHVCLVFANLFRKQLHLTSMQSFCLSNMLITVSPVHLRHGQKWQTLFTERWDCVINGRYYWIFMSSLCLLFLQMMYMNGVVSSVVQYCVESVGKNIGLTRLLKSSGQNYSVFSTGTHFSSLPF